MAAPRIFRVLQAYKFYFDNFFLQKIQHKILHMELKLIFFLFFGHGTLKQAQSLKKGSESVKHDTKAGIMWVWN